jgi:hypothetical protein
MTQNKDKLADSKRPAALYEYLAIASAPVADAPPSLSRFTYCPDFNKGVSSPTMI